MSSRANKSLPGFTGKRSKRAIFGLLLISLAPIQVAKPAEPSGAIRIDHDRLARLKATKMSGIKRCAPFNTPEADAVLSALEVFSPDNPSNTPSITGRWQRIRRP